MKTISVKQPINLKVVRFELNFVPPVIQDPKPVHKCKRKIKVPTAKYERRLSQVPSPPTGTQQKRNVMELVEELLDDLYADKRDWSSNGGYDCGHGSMTTMTSFASSQSNCGDQTDAIELNYLEELDASELRQHLAECESSLRLAGERLSRCVRTRDRLRRHQKKLCAAFTVLIRHISGDPGARFSVAPGADGGGEGGYSEWLHAMRLVARLPAGVPQHFRKKLWLTLSERHLTARGIDWPSAERACFRGTAQPDDTELGAQILKDLHRTGCSLFCGAEGRENQGMLRRVLLAYARWNKDVGYCQGFNMLAAIILEVMDKSESDSLKVMIYLVEAVLPEGYFADDLRGLSADMAAFRDLLRLRLPRLANHMDHLQRMSDGGGVEPPLPDVFTMQWLLTLYATWLPRDSLLRIWDLVLLDGNEVLLLTALAIWDLLQDRILSARSADEYYSCMGGGLGVVYEAGDSLVARVVALGTAPELPRLRNLHRYRVTPPAPPITAPVCQPPLHSAMQTMTKKGLRLFYSEDEGDSSDDGNRMALATVTPRPDDRGGTGDRLSLDIGALKRQYARLRERQRQAHVILAAACARHAAVGVPTSPTSLTVNNLLLGKSAIVSSRGRRLGPPPGAIPPSRQNSTTGENSDRKNRTRSSETISWKEEKTKHTLSRRNSVKWKDIKKEKALERARKASIDLDERGDGIIVSEREADEMIASIRSRSSSDTSSYSSRSESSSDTSLCDDNERDSDSGPELPCDKKTNSLVKKELSPPTIIGESKICHSPPCMNEPIPRDISQEISNYIETSAGEQLRTYIGGFETKLKDTIIVNSEENDDKPISPILGIVNASPNALEVLQPFNNESLEHKLLANESTRPCRFPKSPKNFTDLSPVDLSPCNFELDYQPSLDYNFETQFKLSPTPKLISSSRPPDIIESFSMYPNFVPEIDLSDKNISDLESPTRSTGSDSIAVSEDERPIPLHIDKYFEHSPEFFGARVTDPKNLNIPSRRASKRQIRIPKKPDSLTLETSLNDTLLCSDKTERASSLPQSQINSKKNYQSPDILKDQLSYGNVNKEPQNNFFSIKIEDLRIKTVHINCENTIDVPIERIATISSGELKESDRKGNEGNRTMNVQIQNEGINSLKSVLQLNQKIAFENNTKSPIQDVEDISEDSFIKFDRLQREKGFTVPETNKIKSLDSPKNFYIQSNQLQSDVTNYANKMVSYTKDCFYETERLHKERKFSIQGPIDNKILSSANASFIELDRLQKQKPSTICGSIEYKSVCSPEDSFIYERLQRDRAYTIEESIANKGVKSPIASLTESDRSQREKAYTFHKTIVNKTISSPNDSCIQSVQLPKGRTYTFQDPFENMSLSVTKETGEESYTFDVSNNSRPQSNNQINEEIKTVVSKQPVISLNQPNISQTTKKTSDNTNFNDSQVEKEPVISAKDSFIRSGRKNSERALQIIQENSKILSRILTKQTVSDATEKTLRDEINSKATKNNKRCEFRLSNVSDKFIVPKLIDSPVLKESISDSLLGYKKSHSEELNEEKIDFSRIRPISLDDPFAFEIHNASVKTEDAIKVRKSPSTECLANKTDFYGWENKGFLAKRDFSLSTPIKIEDKIVYDPRRKTLDLSDYIVISGKDKSISPEWRRGSFSGESKQSVTLPSSVPKDPSTPTFDHNNMSENYNHPLSRQYNDFVLSKASDICSKTVDQGPKICENISKTDNSQVSDFANVVTSSISFTYEPSIEDDSPFGAKSNSSDTLCQITSLDQVSTPISPKIFPRDTPTLPRDIVEKSDKFKIDSDDTCSAITSLIETDTLSSLSYPRSPSTGSYHPFPTRPMRMPKELGVRLGMYPKDTISSSPK